MHFSNSSCYKRQKTDQNSYTLLEDVFKKLPRNQIIQIEVKDQDKEDAVREVLKLVYKYDRQSTTIVGSLNHEHNKLIQIIDPKVPTFCDWK